MTNPSIGLGLYMKPAKVCTAAFEELPRDEILTFAWVTIRQQQTGRLFSTSTLSGQRY